MPPFWHWIWVQRDEARKDPRIRSDAFPSTLPATVASFAKFTVETWSEPMSIYSFPNLLYLTGTSRLTAWPRWYCTHPHFYRQHCYTTLSLELINGSSFHDDLYSGYLRSLLSHCCPRKPAGQIHVAVLGSHTPWLVQGHVRLETVWFWETARRRKPTFDHQIHGGITWRWHHVQEE